MQGQWAREPAAALSAKSRRRLNVFARVGSIGSSNLLAQVSRTVSPPSASCKFKSVHQGPTPPCPSGASAAACRRPAAAFFRRCTPDFLFLRARVREAVLGKFFSFP